MTDTPGKKLGKGLGELIRGGAGVRPGVHKPIVKALEELGIEIRLKPVMIGEETVDCLVIPAQELLIKEYQAMSGVDPNQLLGNTVPEPKGE